MKRVVILNDLKESDIRPDLGYSRYKELLAENIRRYFLAQDCLLEVACPGCGATTVCRHFLAMGLRYCVCGECGSWYVSPRPSQEKINTFHRESTACKFWRADLVEKTAALRSEEIFSYRVQWIAGLVEEFCPEASVLVDRGSRYPSLLTQLIRQKLFSKIALLFPECFEQEAFLPREADILRDQCPQAYADVFVAFEQIERCFDPGAIIREAAQVCKPGGIFVLTTTTSSGFEYKVLADQSPNLIPFDRLNLLSFEALLGLLNKGGFRVVEASTPGRLDVEMVKKTMEKLPASSGYDLWKYIFNYRSPEALHSLQEFLQQFQLSSHVRIAAVKEQGSYEQSR
ncbi:MAG: methyltransferase domain-containing protein [Candidatus Omnitrophica bacterium]|nr:methyltransferase domain-containing protein [Candidatus Omnitrophota bacterium]